MSATLARRAAPGLLDLDAFSRATGLHPVVVQRLVALGILHAAGDELLFTSSEVARACRIQRLRAGLGLNYAALGLVLDLLDRIDALEATARRNGGLNRRWT